MVDNPRNLKLNLQFPQFHIHLQVDDEQSKKGYVQQQEERRSASTRHSLVTIVFVQQDYEQKDGLNLRTRIPRGLRRRAESPSSAALSSSQ